LNNWHAISGKHKKARMFSKRKEGWDEKEVIQLIKEKSFEIDTKKRS
jgi:hypothetical protein